MEKDKILEVKDLKISFKTDNGLLRAVRGVSFDLEKGETLCIVGESGSGKSVTSKAIMGILANNAIVDDGVISYRGENLLEISEDEFHRIRGNKIGMIFQDPLSSLNPIVRIGKQITEAMLINSNKLKQMYDDLISQEQMAYKNSIARCKIAIQKAKNKYDLFYADAVKRMNSAETEEGIAYYGAIEHTNRIIAEAKAKYDAVYNEQMLVLKDENYVEAENYNNAIKEHNAVILACQNKIENLNSSLNDAKLKLKTLKSEAKEQGALNVQVDSLANDIVKIKNDLIKLKEETKNEISKSKEELDKKLPDLEMAYNAKKAEKKAQADAVILAAKQEYEAVVAKENSELNSKIQPLKEALDIRKAEDKVKISAEIAAEKAVLNETIAKEKEQLKSVLPSLKAELNKKKKEASAEVKEYKAKIKAEYEEKLANLAQKYPDLKANPKYVEEKQALKKEYVDKTKVTKAEAKRRALEVMKEVGIPLPEKRFKQYPFEFSGGMRQRIVIAIALTATPEILICDEPTTALDVTIQAQILELIKKIQKERNIACIFITHDLGVVANMADRVAVMYAGKIVEYGTSEEIFFNPKHPYTWALLASIPDVDSKERLDAIPGTPPNMIYPPKGDAFALRSKYAMKVDFEHEPPYFKVSDTHYAATWLLHPDAPKVEMPKIVSERIKNALGENKKTKKKGAASNE